jgi:TIR domain
MSGIFISYRREDSAPYAGRLYDRLCARFGAERVFMDVDDILPGVDFAAHIGMKVAACDALIAVVGKDWLTARNGNGQLRFADPNDFVALEVASALRRGILVIPALVGGAVMPKSEELPDDLRQLARKNAVTLHDDNFPRDAKIVIQALENLPALRKKPERTENVSWERRRDRLWKRLLWKVPLILLLVSFAVWWQLRQEQSGQPAPGGAPAEINRMAKAVAGVWEGEVTYSWGAKSKERFFFEPEGDKLFGTATFLELKRGVEDGKIEGDHISFSVRFEEMSGDVFREVKNSYFVRISGSELSVRMQDSRGMPPLEFKLTRSREAD